MSTENIQNSELRSYLLGTADEEITHIIDEAGFTDDAFAERVAAVEREMIDDHLYGKLAVGESERFESYYLASPLRRKKVDFAKAFQTYADGQIAAPAVRSISEAGSFWSSLFAWRGLIPAAAGLLIVAAFIGWIAFRGSNSRDEVAVNQGPSVTPENVNRRSVTVEPPTNENTNVESPTNTNRGTHSNNNNAANSRNTNESSNTIKRPVPAIATIVLLPQLRSSGLPAAKIPVEAEAADFRLELETEAPGKYDISLTERSSSSNVWSRSGVTSQRSGKAFVVTLRVPAKLFKAGNYTLSVSDRSGGEPEIVGDYTFRVVR
ncbi:MAG TPA: hypothetical protein VK612_04515 [Pyrinomonadaceae bacterium]|nr:hypothetical protein [Pyrinomonadaceae bacterium]